ncbi:transposase [Streptomyces sp. NPDC005389]|uniref:transposase n=1 Tax=Streptomyces sp. NPDC005389 TaxID=3157040 RepID=UPI0033A70020
MDYGNAFAGEELFPGVQPWDVVYDALWVSHSEFWLAAGDGLGADVVTAIPGLTTRYQRRTPQLQRMVEDVGVVLAGRGGARMLRILNIRLSRCTVLSQLMRVPLPPLVAPRVLGMDDFALYGDNYGTLLVDAATRLPLTLWEGRDADQLSRWLCEHPGVEVACRDGSLTYRQGMAGGAPDAVQVSDRFHLWQGLSSTARTTPP